MVVAASSQPEPVFVDLNFAAEKTEPDAFEFPFVTHLKSGGPLYLRPYKIPMHDLRKVEKKPSTDVESFSWEKVPFEGLDGESGWEQKYQEVMCEWLKEYLGARACKCTNYQIRRRTDGKDANANYKEEVSVDAGMQPVPAVHVDINRERASARVLSQYDGSEYSEKDRIAIFNIWRPLHGPVMDAPLALCDSRTIDPEDMERTSDKYGGGYFIKYNENMKWMYIRDQGPEDIFVFRQYDNTLEPERGNIRCVAHTAFIDEERKSLGRPRESIELRMAVIY